MQTELYKVGDVLRYNDGPTALFVVALVHPDHGGYPRYYGFQYYGSSMGAFHQHCSRPSQADLDQWSKRESDPLVQISKREREGITEGIVGAVED